MKKRKPSKCKNPDLKNSSIIKINPLNEIIKGDIADFNVIWNNLYQEYPDRSQSRVASPSQVRQRHRWRALPWRYFIPLFNLYMY